MIKTDLHAHTVFCDGRNTPEEMVLSAIDKGLNTIGLVVHSYTPFDEDCSVSPKDEKVFQQTMKDLKQKYKDKIEVKLGVEQEVFSEHLPEGYDYIIGSSHYFFVNGVYYNVDKSEKDFIEVVNTVFNGDYYLAVEAYFSNVKKVRDIKGVSVIGHFDLITKFNENDKLFSTSNPRYIEAYRQSVDHLIPLNIPFEINVGAIARGLRSNPYPSAQIRDYIASKGGKFILSSDAHRKENLAFQFSDWKDYAK